MPLSLLDRNTHQPKCPENNHQSNRNPQPTLQCAVPPLACTLTILVPPL